VAATPIGLAGSRCGRSSIPRPKLALALALALLGDGITARNRRHVIGGVDPAARAGLTTISHCG
jgi:hypothetical protein